MAVSGRIFVSLFGAILFCDSGYQAVRWPGVRSGAPAAAWVWSERSRGTFARTLLAVGVLLGCLIGLAPRASGLLYMAAHAGEREDRER